MDGIIITIIIFVFGAVIGGLSVLLFKRYSNNVEECESFMVVKDLVKGLHDFSFREVVVLVPLVFWSIFLGVYPQPFFERIEVSINHYIELVKSQEPRFSQDEEESSRGVLARLNQKHHERTQLDDLLNARIRSYELAARMQLSVPQVTDLSAENEKTKEMYGIGVDPTDDCGRRCLLGRRLLEQGVRFVQIFSGGPIGGNPRASWDAHEDVKDNHGQEARRIDKPIAGLLADLERRGMLDETLVLFTTEFGRTPFAQSDKGKVGPGRDHNKGGFSIWMAGAGLRPGIAHGVTDEIGWKATESPTTWHDFHATVMHLLGMNHEKLTYYHNGIERRLTNVHGNVIGEILA